MILKRDLFTKLRSVWTLVRHFPFIIPFLIGILIWQGLRPQVCSTYATTRRLTKTTLLFAKLLSACLHLIFCWSDLSSFCGL